jgi:phospholipid-binding lipoprotein MlaA
MFIISNAISPVATPTICWLAFSMILGCARAPGVVNPPSGQGWMPSLRPVQAVATSDKIDEADDYDPWQPFNERMFSFNHGVLDRYLVKPTAQVWDKLPEAGRQSLARALDNLEMPGRLVNNVLQARLAGAVQELARFVVNSTVGLGGLLDVASPLHISKSDADSGQTLALYGVGAGPYLVLPTMSPATVRDAIGHGLDALLDPVAYFLPLVANRVEGIVTAVNDRSLNLKLFANAEDGALDLYSAARNGYLQRRQRAIDLAVEDRHREWMWLGISTPPIETAASSRAEDQT